MKYAKTAAIGMLLIIFLHFSACGVSSVGSAEPSDSEPAAFGQSVAETIVEQEYLEAAPSPVPDMPESSPAPEVPAPEPDPSASEDPPPAEPEDTPLPEAFESAEEQSPEPDQNLPLAGYTICIDPGHAYTAMTGQESISPLSSDTKMQCTGGTAGSYQTESQLNLTVALALRDKLEQLGANVVMTRTSQEELVSNIQRAQIANDAGADLCVRLHADGADDSSAHGISMQLPSGDLLGTPEIEEPSRAAGASILEAVTAATGAYNRGTVPRSDLTGFNWSEVPCVLLEMGFMSNPEEDALLASPDYQAKIVSGIAEGICSYFLG